MNGWIYIYIVYDVVGIWSWTWTDCHVHHLGVERAPGTQIHHHAVCGSNDCCFVCDWSFYHLHNQHMEWSVSLYIIK